jgi:hypothetical protein
VELKAMIEACLETMEGNQEKSETEMEANQKNTEAVASHC